MKIHNEPRRCREEQKVVVLNLSTSIVLFYYTAVIFVFCFHLTLRLTCCNSQIIIDHSEMDGVDKDGE